MILQYILYLLRSCGSLWWSAPENNYSLDTRQNLITRGYWRCINTRCINVISTDHFWSNQPRQMLSVNGGIKYCLHLDNKWIVLTAEPCFMFMFIYFSRKLIKIYIWCTCKTWFYIVCPQNNIFSLRSQLTSRVSDFSNLCTSSKLNFKKSVFSAPGIK